MAVKYRVFITLFLAVFAAATGVGLVVPLLPVYAHELGAGSFQIGLIFGAFSLTRSLFVPFFGKLSDRKGKKNLLTIGLFIYFALSLLYAASHDVLTLILLRFGHGFASAMILPVAQAYVGLITPVNKEGRVMGLFNLSLYIGLSAGPLLGGIVKDMHSIQMSFLCMAALTFTGFILSLFFLPADAVSVEKKTTTKPQSVSYLTLFNNPRVLSLFVFRTCFTICIGITWAFIPLLASTRIDLSSSAIGLIVMINVFVAGLLQAPMGYLADRISKKFMVTTGGILGVVAVLYLNSAVSLEDLMVANILLGFSGGVAIPAIMALGVIEGRSAAAMGSMMGLLALSHSVGMLIGPLLAGVVLDLSSFETVFSLGAVIMGAGTLCFLSLSAAHKN